MGYFGIPFRNGVPIGLGSVVSFGAQQFDPSELFVGGTAGAWYDPSDLSTMFDSSAGTTPVAMPGLGSAVPVGLMLDKSQGLALGPEWVTNGDFSSGTTGWTGVNATLAVVNGAVQITADGVGQARASQTISGLTAGRWYEVRAKIWQGTGALNVDILVTGIAQSTAVSTTTPTDAVVRFVAAGATQTIRVGSNGTAVAGTTYFADNISVRELPGNHAIAANDSTKRPVLMARVNLLEYSEQLDNAYWTKDAFTVANTTATTDPLGGATADVCTPTAASTVHRIYKTGAAQVTAASCRYTLSVKSNGYTKIGIRESSTTGAGAAFDLSGSGSVIGAFNAGGSTVSDMSISSQGNGWFRIALTISFASATAQSLSIHALSPSYSAGSTIFESWLPNGTDGYYIWGADLRPANIGANVPAYQRIADANTYDTSGFPLYLLFDGVDDSMYTPANLNLSGTDKVAVFAGVRKLANTPDGVIAELSAAVSANNGAFGLYAPSASGAATLRFASKGTISSATDGPAGFTAPATAVVNAFGDISGDLANLRFDGSQSSLSTTDQGTGNYGTYPLYIGARNNSSLWFNGHLYSLIIAGSAVSAGNISATEQWVAGKTGITI